MGNSEKLDPTAAFDGGKRRPTQTGGGASPDRIGRYICSRCGTASTPDICQRCSSVTRWQPATLVAPSEDAATPPGRPEVTAWPSGYRVAVIDERRVLLPARDVVYSDGLPTEIGDYDDVRQRRPNATGRHFRGR